MYSMEYFSYSRFKPTLKIEVIFLTFTLIIGDPGVDKKKKIVPSPAKNSVFDRELLTLSTSN